MLTHAITKWCESLWFPLIIAYALRILSLLACRDLQNQRNATQRNPAARFRLTYKLVAALFEASDDVSDQPPLDAVRLDGQECPFLVCSGDAIDGQGLARGGRGRGGTVGRSIGEGGGADESRQGEGVAAGGRGGGADSSGL